MPDIDPTFLVIALVLGAGLCVGWVLRGIFAPPLPRRPQLPFVRVPQSTPALKTRVVLPVEPSPPKWEEDAFFARPHQAEAPDEIDRVSFGARYLTRPSYGA